MFKLSPVVQNVSICLRCQYRLLVQGGARRSGFQRPTRNPKQVRQFGSGPRLRQEQALLGDNEEYNGSTGPQDTSNEAEDRSIRYPGQRRLYPQRKDSLGIDVLGEPAEVLVLRDRQDRENYNVGVIWNPSQEPDSNLTTEAFGSLEILGEIEGERGLVDTDQVCENIEDLRTVWEATSESKSGAVTAVDYARLASQLLNGFTLKQLAAYLKRTRNPVHVDPMDLRIEYSGKLYARSNWRPGITPIEQTKAPKLMRSVKDKEPHEEVAHEKPESNRLHKPTLVDKILRHRWQVKLKQDENMLGELNIRIQWMHLNLIMNHKRGILKQLSETYGAKIEASDENRILRVTSDYDTCLDVLKVVVLTLETIRSAEFDLPVQLKKNMYSGDFHELRQSMLRQIQELTNTTIETRSTEKWRREIYVHYLGPIDVDLQDARRLINQLLIPKHVIDQRLIWASALNPSETVPVPVDVGTGLPLVDRDQQWTRWSGPVLRGIDLESENNSGDEPLNTVTSPLNYQKEASKALNRFFAAPSNHIKLSKEASPCWMPERSYWDSATLGKVVFPSKAANEKYVRIKKKSKANQDERLRNRLGEWRRGFITLVPGLVRSLEHLGLESLALGMQSEEILLIRLTPSFRNTDPQLPFDSLPDLEIQIAFDNDSQTTSIKDVRTIYKKVSDFLLPQNTMDLRFVRRTCVYSNPESVDPRILQFVHNSNLDIWGTERLQTPTELSLEIPPYALRPYLSSSSDVPRQGLVHYTFASLEHRSSLNIPFRQAGSWSDLTYTCIEAGKIGGRSSSLSLSSPRSDPENRTKDDDATIDTFFNPTHSPAESFSTSDESHSSSLLRKANALINMIESRPDTGDDGISDTFAYRAEKDRQASLKTAAAAQRLHLNLPDESPVAPLRRVVADKLNVIRPVRLER